jgi:hypothetical protein
MVKFQLLTQPHANLVVILIVKLVVKLQLKENVPSVRKLTIFSLQESAHLVVTQIVTLALALAPENVTPVVPVSTWNPVHVLPVLMVPIQLMVITNVLLVLILTVVNALSKELASVPLVKPVTD